MEQIAAQTSPAIPKCSARREPLGPVYFGLLLFMFADFARPQDWLPGLSVIPLAKIIALLIVLALLYSFKSIRWHLPAEIIFLALLTIQFWISVPFSPVWKTGAFTVTLEFSKVVALIVVIYATVHSMKRLSWLIFVQGASVAGIAIASVLAAKQAGGRLQGVIPGLYANSNDLALIITLTLPICLALALASSDLWKKILWAIAMLSMVYAVFLTASRGGAIALFVAALICLWQFGAKHRHAYLLFLVPLAAATIFLFAGSNLEERFEQTNLDATSRQKITEASGSTLQRKALLLRSLEVTMQHPLLGVGPGNFETVSGVWRVTHNSYTQVSAEGGIPAFILYLLILWRAIVNLREVRKCSKTGKSVRIFLVAFQASLAAYLIGSLFISVAYHLFPYCLVAYTGALLAIVKKEQALSTAAAEPQPAPLAPIALGEAATWQDTW